MKVADQKIALPPKTVGLIYAGGYGTRLWPVSTKADPKQTNRTFTGRPLVRDAYARAKKIFNPEDIFIVVTQSLYKKIDAILGLAPEQYIVQPDNADTAIAMGLAALYLECLRPGAVAVTIYSDQTISDFSHYRQAIRQGIAAARTHRQLVTVGTMPTFANTHFGYIELGKKEGPSLYEGKRFIEKPKLNVAERLFTSGTHAWNTGLYIWEVDHVLSLFKRYAPDLYQTLLGLRKHFFSPLFARELKRIFPFVRKISFDRAISERLNSLLVVVSRYQWVDIGNWNVVYELAKKDARGIACIGKKPRQLFTPDSRDCLVRSSKKTVALVGVSDIYVIETDDTLLVCSSEAATEIKNIANEAH